MTKTTESTTTRGVGDDDFIIVFPPLALILSTLARFIRRYFILLRMFFLTASRVRLVVVRE